MKPSIEWEVRPGFCLYLAIMLLMLPFKWLLAALAAGALHELGHLLALGILRQPVRAVCLEAAGAKIEADTNTAGEELICSAAGPVVSFLASLLFPFFPRLAFCAFCHAIFNLLPLMPLDGGRILNCIMRLLFGEGKGRLIYAAAERILCVLFGIVGLLLAQISWVIPVISGIIIFRFMKKRNMYA